MSAFRLFVRAVRLANDRDNQTVGFQQPFGDPANVFQGHGLDLVVAGIDNFHLWVRLGACGYLIALIFLRVEYLKKTKEETSG